MTTPAVAPAAAPATSRAGSGIARESLWLFGGYALNAALGFVFWIVAARLLTPAELGHDAALVSIITAASAVASSGVGTALVVMLAGTDRSQVLRRSYLVTAGLAGALGIVAGLLAHRFIVPDAPFGVVVVAIAALCVGWSIFTIQGQALAGLDRAPLTVAVTAPVTAAKLGVVVVVGAFALSVPHVVLVASFGPAILATIVVGVWLLPRAVNGRAPIELPPHPIGYGSYVTRDTLAIGTVLGVNLSLAFLVTALAGPEQGAVFSIAFPLGTALDLVAVSVATALARRAATDASGHGAGFGVWVRLVGVVALGALAASAAAPVVFALLGPAYDARAGIATIVLLVVACVLRSGYTIWTALLRARRLVGRVAGWNAVTAAVVVAVSFWLVPTWGSVGAAVGVLAASFVSCAAGAVGLHLERTGSEAA
ncbi:lipopolysaccharide biosynthesis protein [Homoserinibacter sp. GY 40078]|uniref:lipopolysaccharide biosynthesis protein n=1 Tax=Homoserinibacter sp. GY 40078 TaxID=2603275 RepID=UPI0011C84146|nr:oligosaccharide flippase family protein [Homoserinibacter sp. GY 40078]TXK17100.1 oligosaccharide flippase family protein [Homoserinibacter sp. GY 40078]